MSDTQTDIPEGFEPVPMGGTFMAVNGPLWVRQRDSKVKLGIRIERRHCNVMGGCHGGMLATFADMLLLVVTHNGQPQLRRRLLPTISLQLDFVGAAMMGDWLEGEGEVIKATRSMVFVHALVRSGGNVVVRCSGVYKIAADIGDTPGMYSDTSPVALPPPAD